VDGKLQRCRRLKGVLGGSLRVPRGRLGCLSPVFAVSGVA